MTGSRTAGFLGRIPVESIIADRCSHWKQHGFHTDRSSLCMCSWVDNLFWFAKSVYNAVAIGSRIEHRLTARWNLELKSDSKILQPGHGCQEPCDWVSGWSIVPSTQYLGHIVQTNFSIRACWQAARTKMWKAFWANSGSTLGRRISMSAKFALLRRCVACFAPYRMSRWPPQAQISQELDDVQARMSALILKLRHHPFEDFEAFCRRIGRAA